MSQVLPYEENISRYGNDGDEEQMALTCRLHNSSNFYSSTQNKRAPKLGQIGRSKRGEETLKSFTRAEPFKAHVWTNFQTKAVSTLKEKFTLGHLGHLGASTEECELVLEIRALSCLLVLSFHCLIEGEVITMSSSDVTMYGDAFNTCCLTDF